MEFPPPHTAAIRIRSTVFACAALFCGAGITEAVEIEAVLLSGAPPSLPGMNGSSRLAINNRGDWVARVSRNNGDVVVRNGVILVDNNSPTTTNNSIFSLSINNNGDAVSIVYREDAKVGDFSNGRQVYRNSEVLVTPGQLSMASALPAGTVYRSLYDAVINDRHEVFVTGFIEEPGGQGDQVLSRFVVDANGAILSENIVYRDGDVVPPGRLSNPPRQGWQWEANNQGQVLHYASLDGSDQTLLRDWEILFQEDAESPIPGRIAKYTQAAHLNDSGHWVAHVGFEDADVREQMIMRDGEKFLELGDSLRTGGTLSSLIEPIFIDNDRNVYWLGKWLNPDQSTDTGLFLNDSVLVESEQTDYLGHPLRINLGTTAGSYGVSDDGRFVLLSAYWNGMSGLFRIAVEEPVSLTISPSTAPTGLLEVSCHPRIDVTRVRLLESHDLVNWTPPTGGNGTWIQRPSAGWTSNSSTWTVHPGPGALFLRATASWDD